MKAIFVGCVLFSKYLLETILNNSSIELVGLITKEKSTFNSDHFDLSKEIKSNNIPYKYVRDINDIEVRNWITNLNLKIIFCFGWPSLLKKEILKIPKYGVIGYHPSKLPQNRRRHPYIKKVFMYECLSETEFAPQLPQNVFIPSYFVDISDYIDEKIKIMKVYKSELGKHLFPRSVESIKSLSLLRGSIANVKHAEAFQAVKIID